jgi:uncharacterized protein YkwD
MKTISWLGAFVLFLAVAFGTASVLRQNPSTSFASNRALAAAPQTDSAAGEATRVTAPSPSPAASPKPQPRSTPPARTAVPVRVTAPRSVAIVSTQQALINRDRAAHGLRPLAWSSCLSSIAYSNAVRISKQGTNISHTNGPTRDLGCGLGYHAGENIGWYSGGINDTWANNAFMASPEHRANILSPYYHYVATSWVRLSNGYGYIAVEFS